MSKEKKALQQKLTASQRIEALENMHLTANQNIKLLAGEIDNLRQTMGALARRLNAAIKVGENGNISNNAVNDLLIQENTSELKGKVDYLLDQGVLEASKRGEVGEKSFVVGRELDEDRNVINPRIQFALASILPEIKTLLMGKKVGEVIKNEAGDGLLMEVVEIFDIAEKVEKKVSEVGEEDLKG